MFRRAKIRINRLSYSYLVLALILTTSFSAVISTAPDANPIKDSKSDNLLSNDAAGVNQERKVQQSSESEILAENFEQLFPEDKEESGFCGCYLVDPPIELKYKRAMVPLRHIDYKIDIVSSLVHLTLEQEYENPSSRFLTVRYSVPIRPDSSLYRFEARFGNVVVEGIVKEKEQARQEYEQAKSEGRPVALGNLDVNSKDILNLEIGNIPPRTKVTVTISFVQEMTLGMNLFYQLQVPSTISPRYMNSVPNPTSTEPPAPSTLSTVGTLINRAIQKVDYTWTFQVTAKNSNGIVFYNSPSHKLVQTSESQDGTESVFVLAKESIPNKDFVFVYTPDKFEEPTYVLGENQDSTTIMASFIPKFSEVKPEEGYKRFQADEPQEFDVSTVRGQYIFILDRSGSMDGDRIHQATKALVIFLRSLPPDSYFNIISFGSSYEKMYPESIRYENKQIKNSIAQVQQMEADFGGTEIYDPLQKALTDAPIDGYPRFVFLLTDGTVSNTEDVITMAKKKAGYSRISTIGIGNGASLRLIQGCAEAGKGKSVMISDSENPSAKIISLLESSLTPLIRKITLGYDNTDLVSIWPNPATIPYILKDSIVNFYLTYRGRLSAPRTVSLEYEDSVSRQKHKSQVVVSSQSPSFPFVDKMAHFKVLRTLEDLARDSAAKAIDFIDYRGEVRSYKDEAIIYSVRNQILSEYTSFIAVGKELIDKEKKLFRNVGSQLIEVQQTKPVEYVENPLPGMQNTFSRAAPILMMASTAPAPSPIAFPMIMPSPAPTVYYALALAQQPDVLDLSALAPQPFIDQVIQQSSQAPFQPSPVIQPIVSESVSGPVQSPQVEPVQVAEQSILQSVVQQSVPLPAQQPPLQAPKLAPQPTPQPVAPELTEKQIPNNTPVSKDSKQKQKQLSIDDIINLQSSTGSWDDESLISLAKDPSAIQTLINQMGKEVVLTKLVILWLQKQQLGKQYNLIIKKSQNWLKKSITDLKIDEAKLNTIETI